jgi:hypothetical protein
MAAYHRQRVGSRELARGALITEGPLPTVDRSTAAGPQSTHLGRQIADRAIVEPDIQCQPWRGDFTVIGGHC